jgi:uncharacterized delta-60 repeat protein
MVVIDFTTMAGGFINEIATDVIIQADGKIVIAGQMGEDGFVARFEANGSLDDNADADGGFGPTGSGTNFVNLGGNNDAFMDLAEDASGRLIAAGFAGDILAEHDFAVARFNASGNLDGDFDADGIITTDFFGGGDQAEGVVVQADGKIVVAGTVNAGSLNSSLGLVRYNPIDGSLDATFGPGGTDGNGKVTAGFFFGREVAAGVALQPSGKIVVAASSIALGTSDFMLMRFNGADGSVDGTFGSPILGGVVTDFGSSFDTANAIAIQPTDAKIVVVGTSSAGGGGTNFAVARYRGTNAILVDIGDFFPLLEGNNQPLSGDRSFDPEGSIIRYEWDFNYDGRSFDVDATGIDVVFSAAEIDGPATRTVALRVTNDLGVTAIDRAFVYIRNAVPTVAIGNPDEIVSSEPTRFLFTADDPAPADDAIGYAFYVNFGDGTPTEFVARTRENGDGIALEHVYTHTGSFTIRAWAVDDDGGVGVTSRTVRVQAAALRPSPRDPEQMVLVVGGTSAGDTIRFRRVESATIQVLINGSLEGSFAIPDQVMAYGGAGDDTITVDDTIDRSAILLGGTGNDTLGGGAGRDIHIGGDGADRLDARGGEDVLVAGTTAHDADSTALCQLLEEWRRTDLPTTTSYAQRIDHLMNGGGLNGAILFNDVTVFDDLDADSVSGSAGTDWFLYSTADVLVDLAAGEVATLV